MNTDPRIDDDSLNVPRQKSHSEAAPVTRRANDSTRRDAQKMITFRETVRSMGAPKVNLDRALAWVAAEEDAELARKFEQGR